MSNTTLYTNMLLEYRLEDGKTLTERILWIDPSGDNIVTIDINRKNKHALPIWKTRDEIESTLETGHASIVNADPWAVLLYPKNIPSKESQKKRHKREESQKKREKRRDRAWVAIEKLVQEKGPRLFDPRQRGSLITAQARGKKEQEKEEKKKERKGFFYDSLRRYWQGGQTKNALLPFFDECGAKGNEREGKECKLGRPSSQARIGSTPAGIILTDDVRSNLLRGYKEYYVSGKEKTLPKAHQRTLETYFNIPFDEQDSPKGKEFVPILPSADQLPSFLQFRYIHEKYDDLTQILTLREGERRFPLRYRAILGESTHMASGPGS